jgi:hypothetical protein
VSKRAKSTSASKGEKLRASPRCTSDNGQYGAHSLALRNEIRTWCCVEKSAVTKNGHLI